MGARRRVAGLSKIPLTQIWANHLEIFICAKFVGGAIHIRNRAKCSIAHSSVCPDCFSLGSAEGGISAFNAAEHFVVSEKNASSGTFRNSRLIVTIWLRCGNYRIKSGANGNWQIYLDCPQFSPLIDFGAL